ncbi:hypothetical protein L195_g031623 [Trifolium pratense]|uniref:Uncharacterized protein n=1 Tax=Trifolium pratense TaxID=57577 RepID=A0A2K3LAY3_TRIPR|nr:hypothetical protein L195_g031623 [Trifolium pratense]
MTEPIDDSKANIDDPIVVEPVIAEPIVVEPVVAEPNVVEPDVEEHIVVDTAHFFSSAKKYKVQDDLIGWCRQEALKVGFTVVIGRSNNDLTQMMKDLGFCWYIRQFRFARTEL